jgi:ribosome assembly protein 1
MARSDPSVEFHVLKTGEFVLSTCGEVHLEKCLKDLKDDYAPGVEFSISKPIIPFKETIINRSMRDKIVKV